MSLTLHVQIIYSKTEENITMVNDTQIEVRSTQHTSSIPQLSALEEDSPMEFTQFDQDILISLGNNRRKSLL